MSLVEQMPWVATGWCEKLGARVLFAVMILHFCCGCGARTDTHRDGSIEDSGPSCGAGPTDEVDLLVVWDNAGYGWEVQERFLQALPALEAELPDSASLHVGAVSTDLGTGEHHPVTCDDFGDEATLRAVPGRDERFGEGGPDTISAWLSGVLPESDAGCSVEMFLEAAVRAVTVQSGPGMPNQGFLREESVLVVLLVGNEDDSSTDDPSLFGPESEALGPINTRCALHPERLTDVAVYVDALRGLRPGCDHLVVVGGAIGLPLGWDGDLDAQELVPQSASGEELARVCEEALWADPAPRLARLAVELGGLESVVSACAPDYAPALAAAGRRIAAAMGG